MSLNVIHIFLSVSVVVTVPMQGGYAHDAYLKPFGEIACTELVYHALMLALGSWVFVHLTVDVITRV